MIPDPPDLVILFTRYPQAGHCKTRLMAALGADGAAALHRAMTEGLLARLKALAVHHPHRLEIHYDGGSRAQMAAWLGNGHHYRRQVEGDIGCRMRAAIGSHRGRMGRLLLIGSDCPDLGAEILGEAFAALASHDLVLGPAFDGGYYLIGVHNESASSVCDTLFQEIPWSTDAVFALTKARAEQHQLRCHILMKLYDIDTPDDLRHFHYNPHPQ
jgi:uncharacterized protein